MVGFVVVVVVIVVVLILNGIESKRSYTRSVLRYSQLILNGIESRLVR